MERWKNIKGEQTEPGLCMDPSEAGKPLPLSSFQKKFVLSCIKTSPLEHLLLTADE